MELHSHRPLHQGCCSYPFGAKFQLDELVEGIEHQNPEYHPTEPNYAYIRVKNKSCIPTYGNEKVNFYWAKAGTSLAWPNSWNGNNYFSQGPLLGAPVGEGEVLPILQAGQETIIKIPFLVPNPNIYNWFQGWEQWHFCL